MNDSTLTFTRRIAPFLIGLSLAVLSACINTQTVPHKGPKPDIVSYTTPTSMVQSPQGTQILSSYSGSYALLIGESQYTHGWSKLITIPGELQQVQDLLTAKGFQVEKSMNLNAKQLESRFKAFIDQYGFDKNNRLLFFYSGHGHTRNEKGYLVPTDAPNPNFDEKGFLQKALGMNQILTWARRIEAKHALFLFDSCFSGMVFKAKEQPKVPRQISEAAKLPVRQFITAGSADETVPAKSVFTPAFIDALRFGWGDLYKDGYVTGEELGLYLKNKVPQHADQTPQYGKIKDYDLARGDFVFVVGAGRPVSPPVQPQVQAAMPVAPMPVSPPVPTTPVFKPDSDRDGVADDQDKCPHNTQVEMAKGIYKTGSRRGCPLDRDNDRVPDYRDECPRNLPNTLSQGVDSYGCPLDSDQDGVANYQDRCPRNSSTELAQGVNPRGCPLDSDQDGVPDYRDNCSDNTATQLSQGIDASGCPSDSDLDGVASYQDHCPRNTSKEISKGVNSRGCPLDRDHDGVVDYQDTCLGTPAGVTVNKKTGCRQSVSLASTSQGTVFRDRLRNGGQGPEMVVVPAGRFQMGDRQGDGYDNEKPVHWVSVKQFAVGRYEVTFVEYDKFAEATGRKKPNDKGWGRGNRPVINVSWNDATAYAQWLTQQTGKQYRLPTEAQWEYAARAGTTTSRYWGNNPDEACRYANVHDKTSKQVNGFSWPHHDCTDGYAKTAPVGSFQPNGFGLFDVLGNVWEWTCSGYESSYEGAEQRCVDKGDSSPRALRGGAWNNAPWDVRTASRFRFSHDYRSNHVGLRLARLP